MLLSHRTPALLALLVLLTSCASSPQIEQTAPLFQHDMANGATPWTHNRFDDEEGKFTFALFSDLTGGERDGIFNVAVEQLRLLRPELIVNVGDLIEGGTADREQLSAEWDSFDQQASRSHAPVFYTGGNHDRTHPVMWDVWEQRYGKRYYHFIYKDVLFLVLDTEDNTAAEQQRIFDIRADSMRMIKAQGWGVFDQTGYGQLTERKNAGYLDLLSVAEAANGAFGRAIAAARSAQALRVDKPDSAESKAANARIEMFKRRQVPQERRLIPSR